MSIPGKLLIALLSALAVSALAAQWSPSLTFSTLLIPTAIASVVAVVFSHRALPMPASLARDGGSPARTTVDDRRENSGDRRSSPRKTDGQKRNRGSSGEKSSQKNGQKRNRRGGGNKAPASDSGAPAADSQADTSIPLETGTVKWFNGSKGFGFLIRENGEEVFVHHRSILGEGRRNLNDGAAVRFRVVTTEKGPQAEDVESV